MPAVQTRNALLSESSRPTRHKAPTARNLFGGFVPGTVVLEQQNQPRTATIFGPTRSYWRCAVIVYKWLLQAASLCAASRSGRFARPGSPPAALLMMPL